MAIHQPVSKEVEHEKKKARLRRDFALQLHRLDWTPTEIHPLEERQPIRKVPAIQFGVKE